MRAELEIARQWVAKARNDLLDADNNLASAHVPTDTVCFHCQQAVEKLLKAVLAAQGMPPPRTHVLMLLADQLAVTLPTVKQLDDALVTLTPYAVAARYPDDDGGMPTIEDAREARQHAERVLTWVREKFPSLTVDETTGRGSL
jgi:HEPN domain-containing protein